MALPPAERAVWCRFSEDLALAEHYAQQSAHAAAAASSQLDAANRKSAAF